MRMKEISFRNSEEKIGIGKIVCVGRNYAKHAAELGNEVPKFPIIFIKPSSTVIFSGESVVHPDYSDDLHHEVELVILIGKDVKDADNISAEDAIYGYGVGLDMTLRDLQNQFKDKGEPWTLAKVFDTAAVLSNFVKKEEYNSELNEKIWLKVNGEIKQSSSLNNMVFNPVEIIKFISKRMTLEKGDLIMTGTPEGVSRVVPGDSIEAGIENIGELKTNIIHKNN